SFLYDRPALSATVTLSLHDALPICTTTLDQVMKELGMLEGFDIGLEMSGSPAALRSMLQFMNHGGRVALLGIPSEQIAIDWDQVDRKSTRLNSSHQIISYAVFCLKK